MPELASFRMTSDGLSSGRHGAAALEDAFGSFIDSMVSVGGRDYSFDNFFRPGLSREQVEGEFLEVGISPPDELVRYWTLQGGLREDWRSLLPHSWIPTDLTWSTTDWARGKSRWTDLELNPVPEHGYIPRNYAWENPAWIDISRDHPLMARIDGGPTAPCRVRRCWPELIDFGEPSNIHQLESICTVFDALSAMMHQGALVPGLRWDGHPWWEAPSEGIGAWDRITLGTEVL